jgi:hypothetical protein
MVAWCRVICLGWAAKWWACQQDGQRLHLDVGNTRVGAHQLGRVVNECYQMRHTIVSIGPAP